MLVTMITTEDNPYDPFTQWDDWYAFDEQMGYHTCSYLARVCKSSNELNVLDQNKIIENSIDEIMTLNLTGNYKKIQKDIGN